MDHHLQRTSRPRLGALAATVVCAVALAACGSSSSKPSSEPSSEPSSPAQSGHVAVAIRNYGFHPMDLTVKAGTKITFTDDDQTAHTATSKQTGVFDTGTIDPGKSATVTITKPGTYSYYCQFHAFMTASITVVK